MEELRWGDRGEKLHIELKDTEEGPSKNVRVSLEGYVEREKDGVLDRARRYGHSVEHEDIDFTQQGRSCARVKVDKANMVKGGSRVLLFSEAQNCESVFEVATGLAELVNAYKELISEIGTEEDISYFRRVSSSLYEACCEALRNISPTPLRHCHAYGGLSSWLLAFWVNGTE